jgi:hypothetical protein
VISDMRTWLHEQDKEWYLQGIHAPVFSLVQGCRNGRRLCAKIGFGDKPSHLNMYHFHIF